MGSALLESPPGLCANALMVIFRDREGGGAEASPHGGMIGVRRRVVVLSERIPTSVRVWTEHGYRFRVSVVRSLDEFDRATTHRPPLVVLDAALPIRAGGFDAYDATAHLLNRGPLPTVIWLDSTLAGSHMAEGVGREFTRVGKAKLIAGVACGDHVECVARVVSRVLEGQPWTDQHVGPNPLRLFEPVLFEYLERRTVIADMLVGLAALPDATWQELAVRLGRQPGAMRTALNKSLRPALEALGWIPSDPSATMSRQLAVALIHRRFNYINHYVHSRRRELISLFR